MFEASSALRYACEDAMAVKKAGQVGNPIQVCRADGGPEHRTRNGSVKIAAVCLFCELECDFLAFTNTCPTQSFCSPGERVMSFLNIAWGNLSLCRSAMPNKDDEDCIRSCSSMKSLRSIASDPNFKQAVTESKQ